MSSTEILHNECPLANVEVGRKYQRELCPPALWRAVRLPAYAMGRLPLARVFLAGFAIGFTARIVTALLATCS